MQLTKIELKNFRCFTHLSLELSSRLILIEGNNGVGKTSLLEALHYLCYLRSFRTYTPRDLLQFGQHSFFVKITGEHRDASTYEIQVGFSGKKKLVKINQKAVSSYKELMDYYRIITLTEDDLALINGSPEGRRAYIDQAILLQNPEFLGQLKQLRHIADHRNMLLAQAKVSRESYELWSEQLWSISRLVQEQRVSALAGLEAEVQELTRTLSLPYKVRLIYQARKKHASWQDFMSDAHTLYEQETRVRHSIFGAHLDDILIELQDKKSKVFASRGQQKLILVLLKIAQLRQLTALGMDPIFLLDDFMTDFDEKITKLLMELLTTLNSQLIFTMPSRGVLADILARSGAQKVCIDESSGLAQANTKDL